MRTLIVIGLWMICKMGLGQPPTRFYTKFGGSGEDVGYSAKPTLDGQYIVAGSTSSYGNGYTDAYLVKVDSMGVPLWGKEIGGFGNDVAKSVIQLPDSGYVITGFTNSFGAGGYDAYTARTDKEGNVLWQQTFGGLDWDFASDLVLASDGNIVVVGTTSSFGLGNKDGFAIKYDLSGNLLWQKFIGGAENEELRSVIKTNDNFLAVVGYTESKNDINGDAYFLKLDLNGDTIFSLTYGGPFKDYANDLVQKNNGDYVICGAETFSANVPKNSSMYCVTSAGVFNWKNNYTHGNDDVEFLSTANSFQQSSITAFSRSLAFSGFKNQGEIFTANPGGWPYIINASGGLEDEFYYSIEGTRDGGYVCVGSTLSFGSTGNDVYFVKVDSTIINYSAVVGIKDVLEKNHPSILFLEHFIKISFLDDPGNLVEIDDVYGKKLRQYQVEQDIMRISTENLPPAIYILRVRLNSGQICTRKFLIHD